METEEKPVDMEKQIKSVNKILISLIIIIIIASFLLIWYQNIKYKEYYFEYNGFPVHKIRQGRVDVYQVQFEAINGQKVQLTARYNPKELVNISMSDDVLDNIFSKSQIFITMPSNATNKAIIAATEISKITGNPYVLKKPILTHGALTSDIEDKNVTVKTCSDVDSNTSIIELRYGLENKIYSENGCVILKGTSEDEFIRLANRLTFGLLGVIN